MTETAPRSDDLGIEERSFTWVGRLRRSRNLLIAVAAVLLAGPFISRLISSYHAIVLEVRDDEMRLHFSEQVPRWVDSIGVPAGTIVEKRAGAWSPVAVDPQPEDRELLKLFERYASEYIGTIVEIRPPIKANGASTLIIQADAGSRVAVPVYGEHLAAAAVNRRVQKYPNTWEPELLPLDAPPAAAPPAAAPPAAAPPAAAPPAATSPAPAPPAPAP